MQHSIGIDFRAAHGRAFEGRAVTRDGGEVILPQPTQDLGGGFDHGELRAWPLGESVLFGRGQSVVGGGVTDAQEEDVACLGLDAVLVNKTLEMS